MTNYLYLPVYVLVGAIAFVFGVLYVYVKVAVCLVLMAARGLVRVWRRIT